MSSKNTGEIDEDDEDSTQMEDNEEVEVVIMTRLLFPRSTLSTHPIWLLQVCTFLASDSIGSPANTWRDPKAYSRSGGSGYIRDKVSYIATYSLIGSDRDT